jgi:hypothetical protein
MMIGLSDGPLSGDCTNGGCGWLIVAVKEHEGDKLRILAGGGGELQLHRMLRMCYSMLLGWEPWDVAAGIP